MRTHFNTAGSGSSIASPRSAMQLHMTIEILFSGVDIVTYGGGPTYYVLLAHCKDSNILHSTSYIVISTSNGLPSGSSFKASFLGLLSVFCIYFRSSRY